jgi:hypothetical protein
LAFCDKLAYELVAITGVSRANAHAVALLHVGGYDAEGCVGAVRSQHVQQTPRIVRAGRVLDNQGYIPARGTLHELQRGGRKENPKPDCESNTGNGAKRAQCR